MKVDAASVALSGLRAAGARLQASAHDVANLLTGEFRPMRVAQEAEAQGGVRAVARREPAPAEVDLAAELVEQELAALGGQASLRVLEVHLDLLGAVLDLHG